jgi:hypothetical protein
MYGPKIGMGSGVSFSSTIVVEKAIITTPSGLSQTIEQFE